MWSATASRRWSWRVGKANLTIIGRPSSARPRRLSWIFKKAKPPSRKRPSKGTRIVDPTSGRWRARWKAFRFPIDGEKQALLRERWNSLPSELRTFNQLAGRHLTHCGFTTGASYCSFRCTHCYLPANANEVPIPSLTQMREQIDANRRFQGPGGGLQITGGDMADAYWRSGRQDELIEIVRYAVGVGLV